MYNKDENFKEWHKVGKAAREQHSCIKMIDSNSNFVVYYSSIADMMNDVEVNRANGTWADKNGEPAGWTFGSDYKSMEATKEALEQGRIKSKYLEMVDEAKSELFQKFPQLDALEKLAMSKRRRRFFNEDDGELDLDRYMGGNSDVWVKMRKNNGQKKNARLYIDIAGDCTKDFNFFVKNMVWAMAIADIISTAGIALEIIVGATAGNASSDFNQSCFAFMAKEANEPLDISRLLTFGLSGLFREYVLHALMSGLTNGRVASGRGQPVKYTRHNESAKFFDIDLGLHAGDMADPERMVEYMIEVVEQLLNPTASLAV